MKVKIVSGNQTGQIVDQPDLEAQVNLDTGYAVRLTDEELAALTPETEHEALRRRDQRDSVAVEPVELVARGTVEPTPEPPPPVRSYDVKEDQQPKPEERKS
jgi:hypothetical protein